MHLDLIGICLLLNENLNHLGKKNAIFESLACILSDKHNILMFANVSKSLWRARKSQGEQLSSA